MSTVAALQMSLNKITGQGAPYSNPMLSVEPFVFFLAASLYAATQENNMAGCKLQCT